MNLPLSDREREIASFQMWGELPRKAGTIEDFLRLTDEEEDWFLLPEEENDNGQ